MITLNTNKGLVKVESWNDIESRPGFMQDLNPKDKSLESIIGRYIFKDKIRCGLSNCHTPHSKGYIVTTKDGCETNIGKDCGKTYFGVDFETLSKKFDRDVTASENRESLWSLSFKIEEIEEKLNNIRTSPRGGNWAHKYLQPLLSRNKGCPDEVVKKLQSMVKTRNNLLTTQRLATDKEVEDLEAIENRNINRPYYIEDFIAKIDGLEALYPENELREIFVKELETNLKQFKEKDIDQMSFQELGHWIKWIGSVDNTIEKALSVVASAKQLLTEENLKPFLDILNNHEDKKLFRNYLLSIKNP